MPSDNIKVTTISTGLGTLVLGDAVEGYSDFRSLGASNRDVYYGITCGINWEIGRGYYNYNDNTIARIECISSTNYNKFIKLTGTSYVVNITQNNQDSLNYNSFGTIPENEKFLAGQSGELVYRYIASGDIYKALGYLPYSDQNVSGYLTRETLPQELIWDTGVYVNPSWIFSLEASKVENNIAQWNADKLQGRLISENAPEDGQSLVWNDYDNKWIPQTVSGGGGVVSGSYTANSGIVLTDSNFSMGGTGTLNELDFSGPIKIRSGGSDIVIGQNAASDNGYFNNNSISIGTDAGSNSTYGENTFIGHYAGKNSTGGNTISIGTYAGYNSNSDTSIYIGQGAGITANGDYAIEISYIGGTATRISNDYDIHIQDVIGGNTSTRRLSFGNITMTPDANVEVIATESTTVPFIAKGTVSQTANLIEARSSSNSPLFYVDSSGYISTPSSGLATWNASQLKGYPLSGNLPATGQVLTWNGTSWYAADVTAATALTLNYLNFNPLNTDPTAVEGRVWYDSDNHTLSYFNDSLLNNPIHIGQENVLRVYNATTGTIPKGSVVYINGAHSGTPTIDYALADVNLTRLVIAVLSHDLTINTYGYVVTQGVITDLDTHSFNDGDEIYLSPTVLGGYTSTAPEAPNYTVQIGTVLSAHPTHGSIFVCPVIESTRGNHIIGDIYASPSGKIFTGNVLLNGAISGTLSNTNLTTIDSTPYSSGNCVKYIISAKYDGAIQGSEILLVSNGTDSYMTEYAQVYTSGVLASYSTSFSSSNIVLSAKATNSNTTIHMFKILIS